MAFKVLVLATLCAVVAIAAAIPLEERALDFILAQKIQTKRLSEAEGVKICETVNGVEHCRTLYNGANAMSKEEGVKICETIDDVEHCRTLSNGAKAMSKEEGVKICETVDGVEHCRTLSNGANVMSKKEGVKICETDRKGIEHCRTLSTGDDNAVVMEECFCVRNHYGHKICQPLNCDDNRVTPDFPQ